MKETVYGICYDLLAGLLNPAKVQQHGTFIFYFIRGGIAGGIFPRPGFVEILD